MYRDAFSFYMLSGRKVAPNQIASRAPPTNAHIKVYAFKSLYLFTVILTEPDI